MKTSLMLTLPAVTVRVDCGCVGILRPEGCRGGQYATASVRIQAPCNGTHPVHPVRVFPGVTERFLPEVVHELRSGEVTGHAKADIHA